MNSMRSLPCAITLSLALMICSSVRGEDVKGVDYVKDIRPILQQRCVKCHGPKKHEGGLRLDVKKLTMEGGDSGKIIITGKPAESDLIHRVTTDDQEHRMPPEGKRLTSTQVDLLKRWIADGAVWPDGVDDATEAPDVWSFRPLAGSAPPERPEDHPIDKFVRYQLEQAKLKHSPRAEQETLLRRLSLDLTGLPPSPALQDKFLKDTSAAAYESMVDQLLASAHFGEKWAMSWLDSARYADSDGYEKDLPRPHAWRWRDWVIDAINRDLPFDEFTVQQLAGDLLPGATQQVRQATGFHRNTLTNREGGVDREEFRVKAAVDRTNTTFSVWMGLTVGCAECHSHKYDPISLREYYQLYAFFNDTNESDMKVDAPPVTMKAYEKQLAAHDQRTRELESQFDAARPGIESRLRVWESKQLKQLQHQWKPLASLSVRPIDDNTVELTGTTQLDKVTGIRITTNGRVQQDVVVSNVEAKVQAKQASGRIWLDSATVQTTKGFNSTPAALNPDSAEGWQLTKANAENSLILTTADSPADGGGHGNPLKPGSQDSAANLLNVYYESPVPGRGTVSKIRVYTQAATNNTFTVYLLRPEGDALTVVRSQQFKANGMKGEREFTLESRWDVQRGDLFAHYGNGGPTFSGGSKDTIYYPLSAQPKNGAKLPVSKFRKIPSRRYSLQYGFESPSIAETFAKPSWSADGATLTLRLQSNATLPSANLQVSVTDVPDPLSGSGTGLDADLIAIIRSTDRTKEQEQRLFDFYVGRDNIAKKLQKQLAAHAKSKPKKPTALIHVMAQGNPRDTRIHLRGNFRKKGLSVQPGSPASLPPLKTRGDRADRLDLARWIVAPENPLTARVAVNQIWGELFGQGLVRTTDDFGSQGEPPSHPKLLDWLAREFQRLGWSRKQLIKLIVMSDTYQQASQSRNDLNERDPENRLLARQNRFRLPAELVRDQFLSASTLLNDQIGGPSFRPPLPASLTRVQFVNKWTADSGDSLMRRGMYIHLQRNLILPMLSTFDRPEAILSCSRRERSNTPLQALTLLNSSVFVQASQELAKVLLEDKDASTQDRVGRLFRRVVSRSPSKVERERVVQLIDRVAELYKSEPAEAKALLGPSLQTELKETEPAIAAAWVVACRTVLNLDEAITRE